MAFGNQGLLAVRPGFQGRLQIQPPAGSLLYLSVRTMSIRESIDGHDTSGTSTPLSAAGAGNSQILQETRIQGKGRCRLAVGAQYSAGGTGDPPQFGNGCLYGNIGVLAQAGDIISGNASGNAACSMQVEDYANTLNIDSTIDYDLNMVTNGLYYRTTVAING